MLRRKVAELFTESLGIAKLRLDAREAARRHEEVSAPDLGGRQRPLTAPDDQLRTPGPRRGAPCLVGGASGLLRGLKRPAAGAPEVCVDAERQSPGEEVWSELWLVLSEARAVQAEAKAAWRDVRHLEHALASPTEETAVAEEDSLDAEELAALDARHRELREAIKSTRATLHAELEGNARLEQEIARHQERRMFTTPAVVSPRGAQPAAGGAPRSRPRKVLPALRRQAAEQEPLGLALPTKPGAWEILPGI